jgi:hypothetical protein
LTSSGGVGDTICPVSEVNPFCSLSKSMACVECEEQPDKKSVIKTTDIKYTICRLRQIFIGRYLDFLDFI